MAWKRRLVNEQSRDVEKLREFKRIPEAWSPEEMARILKCAGEFEGMVGQTPAAVFFPALILTLYDTGFRIKAVLTIPDTAFDAARGWIAVPADAQKHRAEQAFRLHPQTIELVARVVPCWGRLFGVPVSDGPEYAYPWLRDRYREIVKRAGLPATERDLFQKIRRTNATQVADVAGDLAAQLQLGHSTVQLTRRNYIDPRQITRRFEAAETIKRPEWAPTFGAPTVGSSTTQLGR